MSAAIANSGNEDVISTGVQQQQQPLIGRYPGTRDSERSHRTNPLDAFDTRDVSYTQRCYCECSV